MYELKAETPCTPKGKKCKQACVIRQHGSVFSEYNGHLSSKDVFLSSVIQHTIPGTLRCSSNALSLASGISALIMVYITNV